MSVLVECPSGLKFNARYWTNQDRLQLTSAKNARVGDPLMRIVSRVADVCVEPGPYPFEVGRPIPWSKVAVEDIYAALVIIRRSMKPWHHMPWTCEDANCGHTHEEYFVDLRALEVRPLTDQLKELLADPENVADIEAPLDPQGDFVDSVGLRVLRSQDLDRLSKMQRKFQPHEMGDVLVALHIADITTPEGNVIDTWDGVWARYQQGGLDYTRAIGEANDALIDGCGLKPQMTEYCEACGREQKIQVPFDMELLFPLTTVYVDSSGKPSLTKPTTEEGETPNADSPRVLKKPTIRARRRRSHTR
jgi:hypothetical protein